MRTRLIRRASGAALALALVGAPAALADDIVNNLDASVDSVAEVMSLNAGGANGTTDLYLIERNGDGKNGCNLTGSTTLVLSISSSDAGIASVSPSSVTFTSCSDTKTLTISPVATGSATISVTQSSNTTAGSFNLAPATFTVNVSESAPANTAPKVTIAGVTGGASYSKGSVPAATCEVTDAEDGPSSYAATLSAITGPYSSDGIGSQTASCSYTDGGGLEASSSVTYSIIDPSAPVIGYTLNPASPDGLNGWYKGAVTLTWTVTESESPNSLAKTGCVDQNITSDQAETTYSCSATSAGGSAGPVEVKIKRDATAPSVAYTGVAGTLGENGWYISPVTATFTATDGLSGPPSATDTAASGATEEGPAVTVGSPVFSDAAGNSAAAGSVTSDPFKIDLTDPTATFDSAIGSVYFGQVPTAPTCTATDAMSGPASCEVSGYSTELGTHTLTATAKDKAGRSGTATQEYTVLAWTLNGFYQPVDMGATVWNTVKGGSTVPLKFEVFAGTSELTDVAVVDTFTVKGVPCPVTGITTDDIELLATGGTSLRYDTTAGQFIQNWQTPKKSGVCYQVTMTTDDGSALSANFKLK